MSQPLFNHESNLIINRGGQIKPVIKVKVGLVKLFSSFHHVQTKHLHGYCCKSLSGQLDPQITKFRARCSRLHVTCFPSAATEYNFQCSVPALLTPVIGFQPGSRSPAWEGSRRLFSQLCWEAPQACPLCARVLLLAAFLFCLLEVSSGLKGGQDTCCVYSVQWHEENAYWLQLPHLNPVIVVAFGHLHIAAPPAPHPVCSHCCEACLTESSAGRRVQQTTADS